MRIFYHTWFIKCFFLLFMAPVANQRTEIKNKKNVLLTFYLDHLDHVDHVDHLDHLDHTWAYYWFPKVTNLSVILTLSAICLSFLTRPSCLIPRLIILHALVPTMGRISSKPLTTVLTVCRKHRNINNTTKLPNLFYPIYPILVCLKVLITYGKLSEQKIKRPVKPKTGQLHILSDI